MITHRDLINRYGNRIPYIELLRTNEWCQYRARIISDDHNRCTKCGAMETPQSLRPDLSDNLMIRVPTPESQAEMDYFLEYEEESVKMY